jgi:DNA polymerase elongation subunit (family B)
MKFESAFFDLSDYTYKARLNDEGNIKIVKFDGHYEYFEPDSRGLYTCITEPDVKLRKVHGKSRDAKDKYGVTQPIYRYIRDNFWTDETKEKAGVPSEEYNMRPRVWYLDIETRALVAPDAVNTPNEVILIQIYDTVLKKMIVLGLKDYKKEEDYDEGCDVQYLNCGTEIELLKAYQKLLYKLKPLLVYAWNGDKFDFPYLYNRMKAIGLEPIMSPFGETKLEEVGDDDEKDVGSPKFSTKAPCVHYMDMMDVYKKFVKAPRPRYSLDVIAEIELKMNKIDHSEYIDFDSAYTGERYMVRNTPFDDRIREKIRQLRIKFNETNDQEVFKEYQYYVNFMFVFYGIRDVLLLKKLDEKLQFTNIIMGISSMMGILPSDSLGTVKPWGCYISNVAYYENKAMPKRQDWPHPNVVGGFVREPQAGKHRNVMNFDVNSMYPQLSIAAFNMSADTFVPLAKAPAEIRDIILKNFYDQDEARVVKLYEENNPVTCALQELLEKYNLSMGMNGALFKKDKLGIIPRLVNAIYDNRKKDKKEMIKYENQKVLIGEILSKRGIKIEN